MSITCIHIPSRCEKSMYPSLSGLRLGVGLQNYSILQGQKSDCPFFNTGMSVCSAYTLEEMGQQFSCPEIFY